MKCNNCSSIVSVTEKNCQHCGHDLMPFGSMAFSEFNLNENTSDARRVKNLMFAELREEARGLGKFLQSDENRSVASILEKRIGRIFLRHASKEAIENLYDQEIIPFIDELSKDANADLLSSKLELVIKDNLGETNFHYYMKWPEIKKMLFAGELVHLLVKNKEIDLTVKMFEFFKVTEVVAKIHSEHRLQNLIDLPEVKSVDSVIGQGSDYLRRRNVYGKDIPVWFDGDRDENKVGHKRAFYILLDMLISERKKDNTNLCNSRNAGLALYVFGRERISFIKGNITINNVFDAKGLISDREVLARDLCELQVARNAKLHENRPVQEIEVNTWRTTAYRCLRAIPEILAI